MPTMLAMLAGTAESVLARAAMLRMIAMLAMFARPASVARATMRWRTRGPHPLGVHAVHDAVELFDDPIEAAGRILACRGPLRDRCVVGSPRETHPAGCGPEHHHAPRHGQPFQSPIHCMISCVSLVLPDFSRPFRGGTAVNSMLLGT
jgi:hypothetical protein